MDASVNQEPCALQSPNETAAELHIFGSVINWLTGFMKMTEEDFENAGIYLGK